MRERDERERERERERRERERERERTQNFINQGLNNLRQLPILTICPC